jgi:hypothetical protein
MKKELLKRQFERVENLTKDDGEVHQAFIQMTKLLRMFYEYLEEKYDSEHVSG